jgi:hypothetical protein
MQFLFNYHNNHPLTLALHAPLLLNHSSSPLQAPPLTTVPIGVLAQIASAWGGSVAALDGLR